MNLSILISNRSKLLFVFIIFILLNCIYLFILQQFIYYKTTANFWYEDKLSKVYHFEKRKPYDLDYVFIGTSRTLYHISTHIFKQQSIQIYNLGIPYFTLYEHALYVEKVVSFHPKSIVISLSINNLFEEPFVPEALTFTDMEFIFKTQSNKAIYETTLYYMKNLTDSFRSRYAYYLQREIIDSFHRAYIYKEKQQIDRYRGISSDCTIFDKKKTSDHRSIVMCTNGDSIIYGQTKSMPDQKKYSEKKLISFNSDYVNYLNSLIDFITEHDIEPIIILEPIYQNHYKYSLDAVKKALHTDKIMDLTNYKIKNSFWADPQHLNNSGRVQYSKYLTRILRMLRD